jgi:flavin-dependent dehydrogenase
MLASMVAATRRSPPTKPEAGRYVVAGGSIAGLATALALARSGASVTVVERDYIPGVPNPEAAFAMRRPGVPQAHFLHAFLGRMVRVLRQRFPDLLAALLEAGARIEHPPESARLADEDVCLLLSRRSTVDWVMRQVVLDEPGVEFHAGRAVVGLAGHDRQVTGAHLDDGTILAGQVVACTGRRGDVGSWLAPLGVAVEEKLVRSELLYITRWYRAPEFDLGTSGVLRDLGYLSYLVVPADAGTVAVAVGLPPDDGELRAVLLDDEGFDLAIKGVPGLGEALAAARARPLRSSQPMAGLVNRLRRFTDVSGVPLISGFYAVGDAHTCTNPAYGRGCSLAFVQSTLLADAVMAHPDDAAAAAYAYEAACRREVEPWFHSSVMMDQARIALRAERAPAGEPAPAGQPATARQPAPAGQPTGSQAAGTGQPTARQPAPAGQPTGSQAAGTGQPAARQAAGTGSGQPDLFLVLRVITSGEVDDPVVLGGFARLLHLLVTPAELFGDPEFLTRMAELVSHPPELPSEKEMIPTREEILKAASVAA